MLKPLSPGLGGTDSVSLILQVGEIEASNEGRGQVLDSGVSLSPATPLWYLCWNSSPSLLQYPGATVLKPAPLLHSTAAGKQANRPREV